VGQGALNLDSTPGYACDFSATVTSDDGLRCIRISRYNFEQLVQSDAPPERTNSGRQVGSAAGSDDVASPSTQRHMSDSAVGPRSFSPVEPSSPDEK